MTIRFNTILESPNPSKLQCSNNNTYVFNECMYVYTYIERRYSLRIHIICTVQSTAQKGREKLESMARRLLKFKQDYIFFFFFLLLNKETSPRKKNPQHRAHSFRFLLICTIHMTSSFSTFRGFFFCFVLLCSFHVPTGRPSLARKAGEHIFPWLSTYSYVDGLIYEGACPSFLSIDKYILRSGQNKCLDTHEFRSNQSNDNAKFKNLKQFNTSYQ